MRILYRLPDHPSLLQTYVWQEYDLFPKFPALNRFLAFWLENLEGPLHSVTVAHSRLIRPAELRAVNSEFRLHCHRASAEVLISPHSSDSVPPLVVARQATAAASSSVRYARAGPIRLAGAAAGSLCGLRRPPYGAIGPAVAQSAPVPPPRIAAPR